MHHHWLSVFFALSAVLLADLATPPVPLWGDLLVKHAWNAVPANWESLGPPPAGTTTDLHIALKPHRENALIDALYEVSDPGHRKYRAHLSKEQVAELVAPHQDTLEIVHSWLEHHGVPFSSISTSHGGGWLTISSVPVPQADGLLGASYQLYRYTGTNDTNVILRTVGYSLPAALHAHVKTVVPTTHFASPRTLLQKTRKRSSEEAAVMVNATLEELVRAPSKRNSITTPSYLRWRYRMETYVPAAIGQNAIGILGFENGSPSQEDLTKFMTEFRADAVAATYTVVEVNGGVYDPKHTNADVTLNIQYSAVMTYPTPQIFYTTGGSFHWDLSNSKPVSGDAYLGWFRHVLTEPNPPSTISISSANPESGLPQEYAKAMCDLFARLGLLGVSVLVSSGDDGVGQGDCKDSDGNVRFLPMFPATCPWVTSIGATIGRQPAIGAQFSGGGFSNYFLRPEYQKGVVLVFLERLGTKHAGYYEPRGRGIPDLSAQADKFVYFLNDGFETASSTSCSTPVVAGLISLLNDYLISNGRDPLGFLNPLLYTRRVRGFTDVARGSNRGCGTDGFPAIHGWDPVTGLGSPSFERLLKYLATPSKSATSTHPTNTT